MVGLMMDRKMGGWNNEQMEKWIEDGCWMDNGQITDGLMMMGWMMDGWIVR